MHKIKEKYTFSAVIKEANRGGAYVTVPFDVEQEFGQKRVKVKALIDGIPYRGSLVRMGGPEHILGILKAIREQIGKGIGDTVEVTLSLDTAPRSVEVPEDLAAALAAVPGAKEQFDKLSYSHQREYVNWINVAKKETTRASRVAKTVEKITTKR